MNFSDFINNILSSSWLSNLKDILVVVGAAVLTILSKVNTSKYKNMTISNNSNLSKITTITKDTTKFIKDLTEQVQALQEENKKLMEGLKALGDVVSISFLESKAISPETKVKIVESVNTLKKSGFDVAQNAKVVMDAAIDEVLEVQERIEEVNKAAEQKAEDTNKKSLSVYNEILDNE